MKKLIFLISNILFGLVLGILAGAQAATITVGSVSGSLGSQVSVPVTIDDTAGRPDCSFSVSFDTTKLLYTDKSSGNMGAIVLTATPDEINSSSKIQPIVQFQEGGATSGTIVYFTFTIKETASIGDTIPLTISDIIPPGTYTGVSGSITVTAIVCTVTISPPSATVFEGGSQTFTASTSGQGCSNGVYTWSVASTIGSTITQQGIYTAGSTDTQVTDTVTVTDTANGNVQDTATVTVNPIICTVTISPPSATVFEGGSQTFTASTSGQGCSIGVYTWSVASTIGSTITQQGTYTAGATAIQVIDTVTVTDTANGNVQDTATVTVNPIVCTVTITPSSATVKEEESKTFTASTSGQGCSNGVYTWSVASTIGSTITQQGTYTAGATAIQVTDTVTVTDTANGNVQDTATVTVIPKVFVTTITPSSVTLASGETQRFTATATADGEAVSGTYTWEISPASTISSTISPSGLYTAGTNNSSNPVQETVVVTDIAHRNAQATATVNVLPIPPSPPTLISPNNGNTNVPSLPTFIWENAERATSYRLTVAHDREFTEVIIQSDITGTTFTPSTALSSEPYAPFYWQVTAINSGGKASSEPFMFILNVTGPQELQSEGALRHAKDANDISAYQMISVPLYPDNKDPLAVLRFHKCDVTVWRLFRYDSNKLNETTGEIGYYHEYDCKTDDPYMDFEPSRAFWLITTNKKMTLDVTGNPVLTGDKFSILLQSGWNQIGNPFAFPVDWIKVTVVDENGEEKPIYDQDLVEFDLNPDVYTSLWEWKDGEYLRPRRMEPWNGYWVNVLRTPDTGLVEIRIPPIATTGPETGFFLLKQAQKDISGTNFAIKLIVLGKNTKDTYNYLGISPEASLGYDGRDIFEPPLISHKQVRLSFSHEEWEDSPGMYATDFRPPSVIDEPFTFIITGGKKGEKMILTWSVMNEVPEGYSVILLDAKKGKTVDMKKLNTYTYKVDKNREREFQISIINDSFFNLLDERSPNFLEDEIDDNPMEDLDLY